MLGAIGKREVVWGYAAQMLNIGAGVLLLPFVLRYLAADEVGLWYVFLALASLAQLLEFGFQPTIVRQSSYVHAGARGLQAHGLPTGTGGEVDLQLLADLVAASRRIYRYVALGAAVVLWGIGSAYLVTLAPADRALGPLIVAWLVFSAGAVLNFYFGYFNGLLQGRGQVTAANQVIVVGRGALVVFAIPLLIAGYALYGLAVAFLASAVVGRVFAARAFYATARRDSEYLRSHAGDSSRLARTLWGSAWRLGLTQVGAFLVLRANIFVASTFLGLSAAAAYGLSLQLFSVLSSLAMVLASLLLPRMNALRVVGDRDGLRRAYCTGLLFAWIAFSVGGTLVLAAGPPILARIGSNTALVSGPWLALLFVIFLLELNHSVSATYITTGNRVPFVAAALVSGLGIVALSIALVHLTSLQVGALVLAQGLVQLAYNNWKWPYEVARELQCSLADYLRLGWTGMKELVRARG